MRKVTKSIISLLLLISMVLTLPIIGYADKIPITQAAGGTGGSVQKGGGGKWGVEKQGIRITIVDYEGNPAFTFGYSGSKRMDLLWSYPDSTYSLWGANTKVENSANQSMYTSIGEARTENYVLTLDYSGGFIDQFTVGGEYSYTVNCNDTTFDAKKSLASLNNLMKNLYPLKAKNYYDKNGKLIKTDWDIQGEKIRQNLMGTDETDKLDCNGSLYAILMCQNLSGTWLWQPIKSASLGTKGFTEQELKLYSQGKLSPIDLISSKSMLITVEPIIFAKLRISEGNYSQYSVYGTQSEIGGIIDNLIKAGADISKSSLASHGGYDRKIFGEHGRRSMVTTKEYVLHTGSGNRGDVIIKVPTGSHYITNTEVFADSPGWALHIYQLKPDKTSTHTWDSENYPDSSTFVEHPAPDPKEDPLTSSVVKDTDLHYRIVKVYEEEELVGDTANTVINHVTTQTRAPTIQNIKIEHEIEPGGYEVIEWKYAPEYYGGPGGTEVGQDIDAPALPEGTPWDLTVKCDNPSTLIQQVPKDPNKSGEGEAEVDIGNPDDPNQVVTLYVRLRKKVQIPETSTLDEPDHPPTGTPKHVPPHPSEDPYPPNVPNDPETDPVQPGDRFATHRIVKVYETKTIDENGEETKHSQ